MTTLLLNEVEARILGCLLEKQTTTPDVYPLSLNQLVLACNQKSNRDPVVDYDERIVITGLDSLREKKLAVQIGQDGARVPKYGHLLEQALSLTQQETAILCVLLLRGAQTPGELKTRTERLANFNDRDEVELVLDKMMSTDQSPPLVCKLPRQTGRRESRYMHLCCGEPEIQPEEIKMPQENVRREIAVEQEKMAGLEEKIKSLEAQIQEIQAQLAAQQLVISKLQELI